MNERDKLLRAIRLDPQNKLIQERFWIHIERLGEFETNPKIRKWALGARDYDYIDRQALKYLKMVYFKERKFFISMEYRIGENSVFIAFYSPRKVYWSNKEPSRFAVSFDYPYNGYPRCNRKYFSADTSPRKLWLAICRSTYEAVYWHKLEKISKAGRERIFESISE